MLLLMVVRSSPHALHTTSVMVGIELSGHCTSRIFRRSLSGQGTCQFGYVRVYPLRFIGEGISPGHSDCAEVAFSRIVQAVYRSSIASWNQMPADSQGEGPRSDAELLLDVLVTESDTGAGQTEDERVPIG
jgi:hypothetical protein